jgi:hypothetical protein
MGNAIAESRRAITRYVATLLAAVLLIGASSLRDRSAYFVSLVGDSAAQELGATVRCEAKVMIPAYACPDGTGFIEVLARALSRSTPTAFENLAVKSSRTITAGLEQVPMISSQANLVIVYSGTNDSALIAARRGYSLSQWYADYDWLLRSIRGIAPRARLILVTVPIPVGNDDADHERGVVAEAMSRHILDLRDDVLDLNCSGNFVRSGFLDADLNLLSDAASSVIARRLLTYALERPGRRRAVNCVISWNQS